ncbi:sigma-70 family RNA polymerase sigma factor [Psychromonas aquimarina]|uniref:sigma-70 family RNA polymerase sigma factor n=1 Tax=Psychromonas aquimarina TaxID=444919 RepID=UPI00041F2EA4|nr:sigma-70 family RNA polymerase sigma factor [Psychromonas aquimarina]
MDAKAQENISRQLLDQTQMLAYAQGDAAAFDQLYARHKTAVYRFFIRQNLTTAVAEELCHDTWLKLINNRASYQANALFTTYLFTIARRIAIDHAQKKSVLFEKQQIEDDLDSLDNQESSKTQQITENNHDPQLDAAVNQTLADALKQQIAALPYEQREVFLLKQEAGFSIDDIARITFQNKEKVKSSWRYALQKMRKGLSFYGN